MIRMPTNMFKAVAIIRVPSVLPPSITRPRQHVGPVLVQSLLETGGDGRAALAWSWALIGNRPSPITLSVAPGRPPSREAILAEADADPEGSTAPPGVPSDYGDQVSEARGILTWLMGVSDVIPLDDEQRGRFIGARDDYARTDHEIRQVRDSAARSLALFHVSEPMHPTAAAQPWRLEPERLNAAWQRGVRDLLDWVLGDRDSSPLTSRMVHLPTTYDLSHEEIAADEVIGHSHLVGRLEDQARRYRPSYGEAIHAAIGWLRGVGVASPIDPNGNGPYADVAKQGHR